MAFWLSAYIETENFGVQPHDITICEAICFHNLKMANWTGYGRRQYLCIYASIGFMHLWMHIHIYFSILNTKLCLDILSSVLCVIYGMGGSTDCFWGVSKVSIFLYISVKIFYKKACSSAILPCFDRTRIMLLFRFVKTAKRSYVTGKNCFWVLLLDWMCVLGLTLTSSRRCSFARCQHYIRRTIHDVLF